MGKFFSNKKLVISLVLLILFMLFLTFSVSVRNSKKTPPLIQQIGNDTVSVSAKLVNVPLNIVKGSADNMAHLINAYEENEVLRGKVDKMAQNKVQLQTVQRENRSLKKQLGLKNTLIDYNQIAASVIDRSPTTWQQTLIIDKGSRSGIKKNMPVMSATGLIGRVSEVNQISSKVDLVSSDNIDANKFAAEIFDDKSNSISNGIVSGYDRKSGYLTMRQISNVKNIKVNDTVSTSGLGGITPKGLLIGKVAAIEKDDFGLANLVYIKPAADVTDVSVVSVIQLQAGD